MIPDVGLYSILYVLFALCVVFPPTEFHSSGLTVEGLSQLFQLLGDQHLRFVQYQIRRTCVNIFVHSCLPFFYFVFLHLCSSGPGVFASIGQHSLYWQWAFGLSVIFPLTAATVVAYWMLNNWERHPIVKCLSLYNPEWSLVASTINDEYRRVDKFAVSLGGIRRVIVTDSWVLFVSSYSLCLSQQSDVRLTITEADEHALSHLSESAVQFINIRVENVAKPIAPFTLRLNSMDYRDLRGKLQMPMQTARDVIIHQSLSEQFVQAFTEEVGQNDRAQMSDDQKELLDLCLGCSIVTANVKLEKVCVDTAHPDVDAEGRPIPNCRQCYCRPMWCVSCMGRWFAARQDQQQPQRWLSSKSPCPTCRATFCLLDVRLVQ